MDLRLLTFHNRDKTELVDIDEYGIIRKIIMEDHIVTLLHLNDNSFV